MSKDIETMKPVIAGAVGNPARTCAGSCEGNAYQIEIRRLTAERDAIAAKLESVRGDQAPTTDDINLQEWKGMEGVFAFHLIDRHADDWNHVARLMNAWLEANREDLAAELKALRARVVESASKARDMREEYRSASCDDVARRVDECMALHKIDREKVRDAIAEAFGCTIYCCTRQWEAWSVGTMRKDDFILASEDDGILDELTDAAISAVLRANGLLLSDDQATEGGAKS